MLTSASTDSSRSSYSGSPVSQQSRHHQVWFPPAPRRRPEHYKIPRYYSTPVKEDCPESTPLQMYGLEQRAPSICEKPKLLHRFSHALDDIVEDISLQSTSEKVLARRRQSFFGIDEVAVMSSTSITTPTMDYYTVPALPQPPKSRPMSILSTEAWTPPVRKLSRRLSISFSRKKKFRPGQVGSISQPNLIGASTQI